MILTLTLTFGCDMLLSPDVILHDNYSQFIFLFSHFPLYVLFSFLRNTSVLYLKKWATKKGACALF